MNTEICYYTHCRSTFYIMNCKNDQMMLISDTVTNITLSEVQHLEKKWSPVLVLMITVQGYLAKECCV